METAERQEDRATALLQERGMMRLSEFIKEGITAATISRMEQKGLLNQLSRGLYQLPDAPLDGNHSLAVAAKLVPNGVICHDSALAFHELTDRIPLSFGWRLVPVTGAQRLRSPEFRLCVLGTRSLRKASSTTLLSVSAFRIYSPAKTIVDLFKSATYQKALYNSSTGFAHATQGMKEALRLRKATPAEIAKFAVDAGIWEKLVQPRLEALTVDA